MAKPLTYRLSLVSIIVFLCALFVPLHSAHASGYTYANKFGSFGHGNGQLDSPVGIALDSSGNVYVADTNNNRIQVFNSSGVYQSTIGSFGSGNGQFYLPYGIAVDSFGNIYVNDSFNYRVEVFNSSSTFLYTFGWGVSDGASAFETCTAPATCQAGISGGGNGQFSVISGIVVSTSTGDIYVADTNNSRIQVFNSSGTFLYTFGWGVLDGASQFEICTASSTCEAGVSGSGNGQFRTSGLGSPGDNIALDSSGNIYVTDTNNARVETFNSSGAYQSKFGSAGSSDGEFEFPAGIAVDSSGNIYVADSALNTIQVFDPSGTYQSQFGGSGSGDGQLSNPYGIAFDSSEDLYVDDAFAQIEEFSPPPPSAPTVTTSLPTSVSTSTLTLNGSITATGGASITQSGFAYSTDPTLTTGVSTTTLGSQSGAVSFDDPITGLTPGSTYYYRAYAVNSAGTSTGTILSTTTLPIYTYTNQFGSSGSGNGEFSFPTSVVVSTSTGNIYVTDVGNSRVEVFDSSGTFLYTFGWGVSDGASAFEVCSAPSTCETGISGSGNGQFSGPKGIALDSSGNIYVSDYNNSRIQIFNFFGIYQSQFGTYGYSNGDFANPFGIAISTSTGDIYVTDYNNQRVDVFDSSGTFLYTFGWGVSDGASAFEVCSAPSTCETGISGSGNGQFDNPGGIALDSSGNIYVSDNNNDRVEVFNSSGVYQSKFGSAGYDNGEFTSPAGISIDSSGNIYVADEYNDRVEVFNSSRILQSEFGTDGSGNGQLNNPFGITLDSFGNVYVTDGSNNRVEIFSPPPSIPIITTQSASSITTTSATGNGTIVNSIDSTPPSVEGFIYGTSLSYGATTTASGSFSLGSFTSSITGLTCNTTYDYKAYATNSVGTGYGSNQTFTTSACPSSGGGGSVSSSGGSVSSAVLSSLLAPSASTTAYLDSIAVPGCPVGMTCTPISVSKCPVGLVCTPNPSPAPTPPPVSHKKKSAVAAPPVTPSLVAVPETPTPSVSPAVSVPPVPIINTPQNQNSNPGNVISNTIGSMSSFAESVGGEVRAILGKPAGNATVKVLLVFGLASDAVLVTEAVLLGPLSSASEAVQIPFKFLMTILGGAGLTKRRKPWGAVYDSQTKRPLDPAVVTLIKGGVELDSSITDLYGRYGFLTVPGTYRLTVGKTNYLFPSKELKGKTEDEVYGNLYFGEDINVLAGQVINRNIPLDPMAFDWNEYAKKDQKVISFYGRHILAINRVLETLFAIGLVFSTFAAVAAPSVFNIAVVCIYVLLFLTRIGQSRAYGQVVDKTTGKPLPFALVEVSIPGTTLVKKATDILGRYYCLVRPGTYSLSVDEKNKDGSYTTAYVSDPFKAHGIIKKKVVV